MAIVGTPGTPSVIIVRDLIAKAFRLIHVLGDGDPMTASEATDALDDLNAVVEQANNDKLLGHYKTDLVIPLVGGQTSYTIGPTYSTPNVVADRPVELLGGFSRRGTVDLPLFLATKEDYNQITQKTVSIAGWEALVYYEARFPASILYVYPVPLDALTTIYLTVMNQIASFATLEEVVSVPPGYRMWLQYKVAMRLAPQYGMPFTTDMISNLLDIESSLKRNNIKPLPVATVGLGSLSRVSSGTYNVYSDQSRP
jgi:hypothetical protein